MWCMKYLKIPILELNEELKKTFYVLNAFNWIISITSDSWLRMSAEQKLGRKYAENV